MSTNNKIITNKIKMINEAISIIINKINNMEERLKKLEPLTNDKKETNNINADNKTDQFNTTDFMRRKIESIQKLLIDSTEKISEDSLSIMCDLKTLDLMLTEEKEEK